jgi:catechol 2,3-dioxygenase-like lactoylglutathione lyase family enzyme
MATSVQVTIDCADPDRLANFWATALGYKKQDPPEGFDSWPEFLTAQGVPEDQWNSASAVVDPDGTGSRIFFQRVPEPKAKKNRVHLDVNVGGGHSTPLEERRERVGAEIERLVAAGATKLVPFEQRGEYWVVMQDPEGNEFCLQ